MTPAERNAVIEECAKIADAQSKWADEMIDKYSADPALFGTVGNTADDIAAMIRGLKLGTGSESATGLAQCDILSPAREQSEGSSFPNGDRGDAA